MGDGAARNGWRAMLTVDRRRVVAFRLAHQHLGDRLGADGLLRAAGVAPQNTPPGSAVLGLRARADVTAGDGEAALSTDRTLVQAWSLRGSPCIVAADELALFTLGLLPDDEEAWRTVMVGFLPVLDDLGWTATDMAKVVAEAVDDALHGTVLTKRELGAALGQRLPRPFAPWFEPTTFSQFTAIVVRAVSLTGRVIITPRTRNEASFARTDQWLGHDVSTVEPATVRAALVRRYLHLYGPSTADDFAAWAGVSAAFAARSFAAVEDEVVPVDADGRAGLVLGADAEALASATVPRGVRLIPPYDPYLQQRDRATAVPDTGLHRRIWRSTGNPGVVLRGGEVVALWRHHKRGKRLRVDVDLVAPLSAADRVAVLAEAEPLAPFRGCTSTDVRFVPG